MVIRGEVTGGAVHEALTREVMMHEEDTGGVVLESSICGMVHDEDTGGAVLETLSRVKLGVVDRVHNLKDIEFG